MQRTVVFALYPDFVPLDLAGLLDVFSAANAECVRRGHGAPYRFIFAAAVPGPVPSHPGLAMCATAAFADCHPQTVVVPGCTDTAPVESNAALLQGLSGLAARAERVVSVCTGALLLAACGLLDGHRATTHWSMTGELARRYPAVRVEPDAIFVRDGRMHTSAGVTTGIDLALSLVEEDLGAETALAVARLLVVYRRRVGSQSQFSAPLQVQARAGARFVALHDWVEERLHEDLPVERLAERAAMSPRHFARVFQAETGVSPAKYVERLRLERARELLESGEERIKAVAAAAGFRSEEQLRRAFARRLGVTPSWYAGHFAAESPST